MKLSTEEKDKIIEDIIKAFGRYALGDIRDAAKRKKPLAAFILCTCFIDQLAGFVYYSKKDNRAELFVGEFMKKYEGMDLYHSLRNKLVHNYSTAGLYRLSYNKERETKNSSQNLRMLNLHRFIKDIEIAFNKVKEKWSQNKEMRDKAIHYDTKHYRVFRGSVYTEPLYNAKECKKLIEYYWAKWKNGKRIVEKIKEFKIYDIKKRRKGTAYTLEVLSEYKGMQYYYEINDAAEIFKEDSPHIVLSRLS